MIFGPPPIEPEILANTLVSELAKTLREHVESSRTTIVKDILRRMGKERGHLVYPDSDSDHKAAQFLLDLVWWKNREEMDIVLAVESELGKRNEVCEDFGKLLVVKAPLKLMIFLRQPKDTVDIIEKSYMQKYSQHVEGEHYLLIQLDTKKCEAHPFHFPVPLNGKLNAVNFRRLPIIEFHSH